MIYRDEFERIRKSMVDRRHSLMDELSYLPEGELYIRKDNGLHNYYQRFRRTGNRKKERRKGVKKDPELLNALVRKKYVTEALSILEKDLAATEQLLKVYILSDENSVMEGFVNKFPELAEGIYHGISDPQVWADEWRGISDFHDESLISTAADGTLRRSKGELLIGARLDQYKIPYRYEALAHPDLPYRPDFMISRPKDGKIFFWEHLGLVNDPEYMANCRKKFSAYETAGIVPWDNLIITYDQADGGINEKLIDAMIHGWLL